jgi:hypothetical protein
MTRSLKRVIPDTWIPISVQEPCIMEIDLFAPTLVNGLVERGVTVREELPTGQCLSLEVTVWVEPDDRGSVMRERAKAAAIEFLQRALDEMRKS